MKISIAGGGIGGCVAALCLAEAGHDVDVYESVIEPAELGVGINVLPHSVRVLDHLGLLPALDRLAVRTGELRFVSANGTLIWSEPRGLDAGNPWPQFSIHRGRLHKLLLDTVAARLGADRLHTGHRVISVAGTDDGATSASGVFLHRGSGLEVSVESDVLVGADGLRSMVRQQLYPEQGPPHPSGLVLWRGAVWAQPFLDGRTMFMAGDDRQKAVVYPLTERGPDGLALINWVAERPMEVDTATASWNRAVPVADVAEHFATWDYGWVDVADIIASSHTAYEFPMIDRTPVDRWSFGRITLLGDAAHPMRPNGSNGSSQAILDGEALTTALDEHDDPTAALQAYEAERLEPTAKLTYANRQAGPERVMQWVADRCDGTCVGEHHCVEHDALEREANAYKQLAGFDLAHLKSLAG